MKLAIPTRGNVVDDHFGHCEMYTIISTDDNGKIVNTEFLPSPQGCGCKSNIASMLQQIGVSVMLAGNMGTGALNILNQHGVTVYRGNAGDVNKLAIDFLEGKIKDSGIGCHHHEQHGENHVCNH